MKKRILSMILAIAMVASIFAGIAVTASAAEGTYVLADALAVGDIVVMASADGTSVFTGVTSKNIGGRADASPVEGVMTSADAVALTVEAGSVEGSLAFNCDGKYLAWTSGNNLYAVDAIDESSSWTVTIEEGVATVLNVKDPARKLQYNSGSPRFCAYTSSQKLLSFYKLTDAEVCLHTEATSEIIVAATCTEPGVEKFTCSAEGCGTTWEVEIPATGHSFNDGVVTTAATCTEAGVMTYTCVVCNETKTEAIAATGHNYVDGACSNCGEAQPEGKTFKAVAAEDLIAGNYIIAVDRNASSEYPVVYPATSGITSGHWVVSDATVTAAEELINSADLPIDAVIFALEGDSTNGFTISYTNENGEKMYLGYSSYAKAKNAFAAEYSNFLWKAVTNDKGAVGLQTGEEGSLYTISGNSTAVSALRGYANGTVYNSVYFFKEVTGDEPKPCEHTNTSEIAAVEATCTTDGNTAGIKCDDCGKIISGNETVPATGHEKAVTVVDGAVKTVCAKCGEAEELVLNTIAEAKAYTDKTVVYNVKGIVTYVSGRNVYIQDEEAGLCVYFAFDFDTSKINRGDEIFVSSTMTTYKGLIEINLPKEYFVLSTGNTVEAQIVDLATLAADTTNEYLGEKVFIENAVITEIATNGSVTLEQNGTTMILYKAPALNEDCVVGATVNVTAVVSTYNTYQLLIQEAADVVAVTVEAPCTHENVTVLEAVAPTCTETGLTEGAQCADCGEITVAQEVVPALGHANTTVSNGDGTHTTTCANCKEATVADCDYVDGVCTVCGAEEPSSEPTVVDTIKLGHTLNLASDISVNYAVTIATLAEYDSYYLEVLVPTYVGNEMTGYKTVVINETTTSGSYYYFTLTGITAVQMNDMVEARLYMTKGDEKFVTNADLYSVGTYAYNQLNKANAKESLKSLCADLLRYGSNAQIYKAYRTDSLVDANMTDDMKAYLSDIDAVTFNNNKGELSDLDNSAITWVGRSLSLDSKVIVKFMFSINDAAINAEDLTAKITYENYEGKVQTVTIDNVEVYNASKGYYAISVDCLLAAELRCVLNAAIYNGETRISNTATYSADTYGNNKTGTLLNVCKALMAYSDTALAYFNN